MQKFHVNLGAAAGVALVCFIAAGKVQGHHNYTRPNTPDPGRMLALFDFDDAQGTIGTYFESPGFDSARGLRVATPSAGGNSLTTSTDVAYPVLGPNSVLFNGRQSLISDMDFAETVGDCTIEFWVKWQPGSAISTLQVGANAGPKLVLTRDYSNSLNDRFGILTAHGDFRPAPGFTDWTEWDSEPTINGWWVMAMAIHSAGTETVIDPDSGHEDEVYKPGSWAIFFVNDHPVGDYNASAEFLGKVDISGMTLHSRSNLYVRNDAGSGVMIDDFIFWKEDLTQGGAVLHELFDNGRGPDPSGVKDWRQY